MLCLWWFLGNLQHGVGASMSWLVQLFQKCLFLVQISINMHLFYDQILQPVVPVVVTKIICCCENKRLYFTFAPPIVDAKSALKHTYACFILSYYHKVTVFVSVTFTKMMFVCVVC